MPSTRDIRRRIKSVKNTRQPRKNNFEGLVDSICLTHHALQENAVRAINYSLTIRNWLVGHHIVEFEQNGRDRAKYGDNLIGELAAKLKKKGLKGFSISALKNHRTFYLYYPQISQSVIGLLENIEKTSRLFLPSAKSQTVSGLLKNAEKPSLPPLVSAKSQTAFGFLEPALIPSIRPVASLASKQKNSAKLPAELLLSRLNYSHFLELMRVEDALQRLFYEVETIKNNWSVRELKRAIGTSLAFKSARKLHKKGACATSQ